MKTIGIVSEYNPFHTGHKYHIDKSKKLSGADCVIAVMSGNFVQRGEPAIADKWLRTQMALLNGVDIVLELPVLYACSSAQHFARGAIKLLNDTGIVDILSFGSETGDILPLKLAAKALIDEGDGFTLELKKALDSGIGFAAARNIAMPDYANVLSSPNNILGIEYLMALDLFDSPITPMTIKRHGAGYNDLNLSNPLPSASAIRLGINEMGVALMLSHMPINTHKLLKELLEPITLNDFSNALAYQLRRLNVEDIATMLEVTEGLENRIKRCSDKCIDITSLAACIKSKRYTLTKIQRILIHILLEIKTADMDYFNNNGYSPYIRVLGFRKNKQHLLKRLTENATVPVITNLKNAHKILDYNGMTMLSMETKATDIYFASAKTHTYSRQDYTRPMVIIP